METLTLRIPFWRTGDMYGCAIATVGLGALLFVNPSKPWWWYAVALLFVGTLWLACLRRNRSFSVRVDAAAVEVQDPFWGMRSVPRSDVTSVQAHVDAKETRGQFWYLHTAQGPGLRLRTIWRREQLEKLGLVLDIPVCFGGPDCPHGT